MHWIYHTCPKIGLYRKSATRMERPPHQYEGVWQEGLWARLGRDWLSQRLNQSFLSDQQFLGKNAGLSHSCWVYVYHLFPTDAGWLLSLCFGHNNSAFVNSSSLVYKPQTWDHSILLVCPHCYPHIPGQERLKEIAGYRPLLFYWLQWTQDR